MRLSVRVVCLVLSLVICAAACLTAHAEDDEEYEAVYGRDIFYYGDYTYSLKDGQATIICLVYRGIDERGFEELDDWPGRSDPDAIIADQDDDMEYTMVIPKQLDGHPVVAIGNGAFQETLFSQIIIPEGITSIGDYAFAYCYYFDTIIIPNGVTSIGEGAFQNCDKLKKAVIPSSVTFIGDRAFGWYEFNDSSAILSVVKGSYAEEYAREIGIAYRYDDSVMIYNAGTYARATDNLATRSGPSTRYTDTGTYNVKSEYVRVISVAYDVNELCWVQCDVPYRDKLRRVYSGLKRFDEDSFDVDDLPEENPLDEGEVIKVIATSKALYGPGDGYDTYGSLTVDKDQTVIVITTENDYAQVEWTTSKQSYRAWVHVDVLETE